MPTPRAADGTLERFAVGACRERWLEFVALEHETLLSAVDFAVSEEEFLVRREPPLGRLLAARRIPRPARAALLLQAAAASAFFASRGFPLSSVVFEEAVWDGEGWAAFVADGGRAVKRAVKAPLRNGAEALVEEGLKP